MTEFKRKNKVCEHLLLKLNRRTTKKTKSRVPKLLFLLGMSRTNSLLITKAALSAIHLIGKEINLLARL